MGDFKARYEVNDGYAGGSRPQSFKIREGDYFFGENPTDDQILEVLYGAVEEDMHQKIGFHKVNESEFIEWAREQIKAEAQS